MEDGNNSKATFLHLLSTDSSSPIISNNFIAGQIGSLEEVTSRTEQNPTENTDLFSADISVSALPCEIEASAETNLLGTSNGEVTSAVLFCSPCQVEKDQPKPLCALLPSPMEVYDMSQAFTSISKSQLKTTSIDTGPSGDDLCAAVLLACLFCHPLDCLLASARGCSECIWSLCSSLCSCGPGTMQPLLDITHHCDFCGCVDLHCCLCDCSICELCLHATECLDLAMEISQMLFH